MPLPERGVALQARSKTFTEVALFVSLLGFFVCIYVYLANVSLSLSLSLCSLCSLGLIMSRSLCLSHCISVPLFSRSLRFSVCHFLSKCGIFNANRLLDLVRDVTDFSLSSLSVCLSVCLSLSLCVSLCISVPLSLWLSVSLCLCLCLCLSLNMVDLLQADSWS